MGEEQHHFIIEKQHETFFTGQSSFHIISQFHFALYKPLDST